MKRLWQAALQAKQGGITENGIFFDVTDTSSPYGEATVKNAYTPFSPSEGSIAVNPYYSYGAVFGHIIKPGKIPELTKFLCDLILHHLCEVDSVSGMDLEEFYVRFLEQDIRGNAFGAEVALGDFTDGEIRKAAYYYLRLVRTGSYEGCFCDILRYLYPSAWVSARDDKSLLVIVNTARTARDERRVKSLCSMFLQAGRKCHVYWDMPPVIVECPETAIGRSVLF